MYDNEFKTKGKNFLNAAFRYQGNVVILLIAKNNACFVFLKRERKPHDKNDVHERPFHGC